MAAAAATVQTSWCFLWECPSTPRQRLTDPGSPWPSWSGTGVQEQDCPSRTVARLAAASASAAALVAAAPAAAAPAAGPPSAVWVD